MPGGTQKYEREIAEILERMERDEPRGERVKRQARYTLWQRWQTWQRSTSRVRGIGRRGGGTAAWGWIGLTLAAGIAGLVLSVVVPVAGPALGLLGAIVMVGLFFSPLLRQVGAPPDASSSTMWRGKVVDLPPRGGLFATLGYYWRRFRRGRRF